MSDVHGRAIWTLCAAAALLLALAAPSAQAATGRAALRTLSVSPAKPKATDDISVSFVAGRLAAKERYVVTVASDGDYDNCTPAYELTIRGRPKAGRRVTVTLLPDAANGVVTVEPFVAYPRFCAGTAVIRVGRVLAGRTRAVGRRSVRIVPDGNYPSPSPTDVAVTVLDGSTATIRAAGRADRTMPVGGSLKGRAKGRYDAAADLEVGTISGALWLRAVQPDPLCAGAAYRSEFAVTPGGASGMLVTARNDVPISLTLELSADPISMAGCATPIGGGMTRLALSGARNANGLAVLPLTGTLQDVAIGPGVLGTVTLNLLARVDLSARDLRLPASP